MLTFIKEYIKDYRAVGAVIPSSKSLTSAMLNGVDFSKASVIVEYGAGTGVFTKEILRRKNPETKFLVIERNKEFYHRLLVLVEGCPNTYVVCGDASFIDVYCGEFGIKRIDYIISGLPFTSLPKRVASAILHKTTCMLGDGVFITFQYSKVRTEFFSHFFPSIVLKRIWRNFPPAYVFTCSAQRF